MPGRLEAIGGRDEGEFGRSTYRKRVNVNDAPIVNGSVERLIVVVLVGLLTIGNALPGLAFVFWPPLTSGYAVATGSDTIARVRAGSVAARAGLHAGDRMQRPLPVSPDDESEPASYALTIVGPGARHTVTLRPEPQVLSFSDKSSIVAGFVLYVFSFGVGAMLLMLRPSAMTWGFFAYCVFQRLPLLSLHVPGGPNVFYANWAATILVMSPGLTGVIGFASRFPSGIATGWRRTVERASYAFIPITIFEISWPIQADLVGAPFVVPWWIVVSVADAILIALIVDAFVRADHDARQRLAWIVVLPLSLTLRVLLAYGLNNVVPSILFTSTFFELIVPVFVLYAVLRHHLFDIRFVASRAATLAFLSGCVVLFFVLADFFVSKNLAATKLAVTVDLAVAVALGFAVEFVRRRVERVIELLVFRDRHTVEEELVRTAHALENADTAEAIDGLLILEVPETLKLRHTALYRLERPDFVLRTATAGYAPAERITSSDPLVSHLKAERKTAIASRQHGSIVIPIPVRGQLYGLAILGPHTNGTRLDPDEIKLAERVFARAGFAYDHAEAEELLARIERQEAELRVLRAERSRPAQSAG
ncbi:MAG: hypothetical protein IAI48_06265 [Candidatus Eremiobacteraeota bacterium]|nr:hypothetical protein [Candidatus Eremiobacteraeota bacterium]